MVFLQELSVSHTPCPKPAGMLFPSCSVPTSAFYQLWHLTFRKFRDDLAISGSPNRTLRRLLFEDISGRIYLLEEYDIRKKAAQSAQNRILEFFRDQHLSGITPALQADRGEPGVTFQRSYWQIQQARRF